MAGIIVEDHDSVRWIYFNRPEQLNTYKSEDLIAALEALLDAYGSKRVVVFSGAGERAFSAGMNLDLFRSLIANPATARGHLNHVRDLLSAVRKAPLITIAAINGHCLGAAFELMLACDFRVAVETGMYGLPEIKLGLPCILEAALLQQHVGLDTAKRIMLTGELVTAHQMQEHGVLRIAGGAEQMRADVDALAGQMSSLSPVGVASQKRIFDAWQNLSLDDAVEFSLDEIVAVFAHPDTHRTIAAYDASVRAG